MLDPGSPVPIHFQLKALLLDDIRAGRLGPGDRLPTEHELCATHGISRTPVSRALSELAADGVIVRYRRRGSFVSRDWKQDGEQPRLSLLLPESPVVPAPSEPAEHVAIDVTPVPHEETNTQLLRLAAEGTAPDLALVDLGQLATLVESELVRPLDLGAISSTPVATLLGPAVGGAVYAIPAALSLTGLWMNPAAGLPPTTWDELLDMLRTIRDTDSSVLSPLAIDGSGRSAVDVVLTVLASNEQPGAPLRFHPQAAQASFRFLRSLVEEALMPSAVVGSAIGSAASLIASGDAVAIVGSSTDAVGLGADGGSLVFSPFPAGPGGEPVSVISGWGIVVTRQSRLPDLAARTAGEIAAQADDQTLAALGLRPANAWERKTWRGRAWEAGHRVVATQLERVLVGLISGAMRPGAAAGSAQQVLEAVTASAMP